MKKWFCVLVCVFVLAAAAETRWKIDFLSGDVSWRQAEGGIWKKCRLGDVLETSAMIRTGKQSTVTLVLGTRTITIRPESIVTINAYLSAKDAEYLLDLTSAASRLITGVLHERRTRGRVTETLGVRGDDTGTEQQPAWSEDLGASGAGDPVLERAQKDYDAGKYELVVAALKDGEMPGGDDRACLLGMSYFNLGYYQESLGALSRAASSKSLEEDTRTRCRYLSALSRIYLGDHEGSIADLEALAEAKPGNDMAPRACFVLAGLYRIKGDAAAAKQWYEALISRYPSSDLVAEAKKKLAEMH